MGISSDGILVFGIELGLEDELPEFMEDHTDFCDFVDAELGIVELSYPERKANRDEYPVNLVLHCSYDYPMYILAVPEATNVAWRGNPHSFSGGLAEPTPERISAFKKWAGEHGIEGEPCWILTSLYG